MAKPVYNANVVLPHPHDKQLEILNSKAKRKIIRAGRRGGKTVVASMLAVMAFVSGKRVLYAAPTGEQTGKFWFEVTKALRPLTDPEPIEVNGKKVLPRVPFRKNEAEQFIEKIGTEQRIKAKTAWNPDTLRGDFGDLLILDEFQLMDENTWDLVGEPMLLDHDGDAIFIYTPKSLQTKGSSKAKDYGHAAKMFKMAKADKTGLWNAIHFTSHDNPFINKDALSRIAQNMSRDAYRKEILAEDDELELSWLVYSAFNEEKRKVNRFDIPMTWPVYTFHDFGAANPAALIVAQTLAPLPKEAPADMRPNDWVVFREYLPGAGKSAMQHVAEFKRLTFERMVVSRIGGSHQEEEIRQGYAALGWPIQEPKIRGLYPQVDKVIRLFEDSRIWVFNDLYGYLNELMTCMWKSNMDGSKSNEIKDEAKFHLSACARYGFSHPNFVPTSSVTNVGSLKPIESLHFGNVRRPIWARG